MKTIAKLFAGALLLAISSSALADVHYVDVNSTSATPPYTNWSTAATNIQDAVDAAVAGDEIVVTSGTYYPIEVDKPLNVRSINGPLSTTIDGGVWSRCAYLASGASLSGFTLTHGYAGYGAGVFCESRTAVVSNCVVSGNIAQDYDGYYYFDAYGGGAYGGTLKNCTLTGNRASGVDIGYGSGGDYGAGYGGGAYDCTLNNCTLTGNSATGGGSGQDTRAAGGGAAYCTLNNCTLRGNSVRYDERSISLRCGDQLTSSVAGGGAYACTLNNCTLSGNNATGYFYFSYGSGFGCGGGSFIYINIAAYDGGAYDCTLKNSIRFGNTRGGSCEDCGWDPRFVDLAGGNLRLQSNSPCIDAGLNAFTPVGPDLDGNPRIVGDTVDIGAYEFQSLDLLNVGVVSNRFGFNVTGQSNSVIILEASSDFTNWTPLTTNTLSGSPFPFRDPTPPNLPQRFYRARLQ